MQGFKPAFSGVFPEQAGFLLLAFPYQSNLFTVGGVIHYNHEINSTLPYLL